MPAQGIDVRPISVTLCVSVPRWFSFAESVMRAQENHGDTETQSRTEIKSIVCAELQQLKLISILTEIEDKFPAEHIVVFTFA